MLLFLLLALTPAHSQSPADLTAELQQQHPQWGQVMQRARDLLAHGDPSEGAATLEQALDLARNSETPLLLAQSLEAIAAIHIRPQEALAMLEEAYEIKERELGPRHPAIVETLIRLADQKALVAKIEDPETDSAELRKDRLRAYHRARDVLVENYGDESCEVGYVDNAIGYVYLYEDVSKAEKQHRYVLSYCPVDPEDHRWESAGVKAVIALRNILFQQGRDEEMDSLPEVPKLIEPPAPDDIPAHEEPGDVPLLPQGKDLAGGNGLDTI